MSQTLYRALKANDPYCTIDVLAPSWCLDVARRMPEVRQTIALPIGHGKLAFKTRYQLAQRLRATGYQQAIVLPNSWKSALIPWLARIPQRTGWLGEFRYGLLNDHRHLHKTALPLMVQRFIALAYPRALTARPEPLPDYHAFLPQLVTTPESVAQTLQQLKTTAPTTPVLALAPGAAFGDSKRWPEAYFAQTAHHYLQQGWQVWLLGSPDDQPVLDQIQRLTHDRCQVFSGQASLSAKIDLLSLATAVVSNDSGLLHIAAALNRPTLGIYGSTTPEFTPPLGQHVAILETQGLACRPCFKRQCPLSGEAHLKCLWDIKPQQVITVLANL